MHPDTAPERGDEAVPAPSRSRNIGSTRPESTTLRAWHFEDRGGPSVKFGQVWTFVAAAAEDSAEDSRAPAEAVPGCTPSPGELE